MRDWPHGVTGTRNEHLLRQLDIVLNARQVRDDEREAFRQGFIEGWQARGLAEPGEVRITREELARLQRKAGEGPMVFP
jgi:hypothetical protein